MNNIGNFANLQGLNPQTDSVNTSSVGVSNTIARQQQNYNRYLLNSLDGLAAINLPYMQMNLVEQIRNCDGVIGDFKQGLINDSWLLSGLKSLSYTTEGSRLIKQAINKNLDNSVTVTFKGVGKSYKISKEEFEQAAKEYRTYEDTDPYGRKSLKKEKVYAKGDPDVLAFELAMEKLRKDISEGAIDKEVPNYTLSDFSDKDKPLNDSLERQIYYLLSGNEACTISAQDPTSDKNGNLLSEDNRSILTEFLDKYKQNPNRYAVSFNLKDNYKTKDVYGNTVRFIPEHAYALKSADSKTAILSDPLDSAKPIRIPLEEFKDMVKVLNYQDVIAPNEEFNQTLKKSHGMYSSANEYIDDNY